MKGSRARHRLRAFAQSMLMAVLGMAGEWGKEMKPMGRKPVRFPSKEDCHPQRGHVNWWEAEIETASKAVERDKAKKEIAQALINEVPNLSGEQLPTTDKETKI